MPYGLKHLTHLHVGEEIGLGEPMAITAPQNLGPRAKFQDLPQHPFLAVLANNGEDLANVSIDILVDRCQVPGLAGEGVAGVQEHDGDCRVGTDERLQV